MNLKELVLGQEITVTHKLIRKSIFIGNGRGYSVSWIKQDIASCKGIVIGTRTLYDGKKYYEEEGTLFSPESHFQAVLVVTHIRRKPFYTTL